ncbi:hypothetical protein TNCV_2584601 [Trichonephila clavipes]|nr:hypothetical protein TNCV_2584601 [Trichonephila clavipes]
MEAESYLDDYNPETYEEAINSKDSTNWKKAMESEMNSLESENHTWELSDLPVGAKAIPLNANPVTSSPMLKDCRLQKSETKNSDFSIWLTVGYMYPDGGSRPDLTYSV